MNVEDIILPEQDPAGKIAQMVADLKFSDIPEEHVDYVKKDILDMMGCIIAGTTENIAAIAAKQAASWAAAATRRSWSTATASPLPSPPSQRHHGPRQRHGRHP